MELEQSFREVDVVKPVRGQKILEDLAESFPFQQVTDVEPGLGHDIPEGIEEGEAIDVINKRHELLESLFPRLRPSFNLIPVHPGLMGVEPEGGFKHPGGRT